MPTTPISSAIPMPLHASEEAEESCSFPDRICTLFIKTACGTGDRKEANSFASATADFQHATRAFAGDVDVFPGSIEIAGCEEISG